jgi:hypothetical protein
LCCLSTALRRDRDFLNGICVIRRSGGRLGLSRGGKDKPDGGGKRSRVTRKSVGVDQNARAPNHVPGMRARIASHDNFTLLSALFELETTATVFSYTTETVFLSDRSSLHSLEFQVNDREQERVLQKQRSSP